MKIIIWLSCHLAGWSYGIGAADLYRVSWRESRHTTNAVSGSHHGAFQVSTRWSRYNANALHNPLIGALEAARLLAWARRHCGGDGLHWYRTGRCGGGQ